MRTIEELTGATQVTSWVPADVYADLILEGVVCYGQLSGVISAMEYDFSAGGGDTIQVRYVSPRTGSCASTTACSGDDETIGCLSGASTTFGTYNVPIAAWGDYDNVCGWSIFTAKGNIVSLILSEMAKRHAKCRDAHIWSAISSYVGVPNYTHKTTVSCVNIDVTSCCTYKYDLYNSVVSVMKHLQADGYEPDYVIMNPEVAKFLYWHDAGGYFYSQMPGTSYDGNGQLKTLAGLKVIESCNAGACSGAANAVEAVVIDSRRAVGEVWGKRPEFTETAVPKCNRYELVSWMYWGAAPLDAGAIGWITNP